MTILFQVKEDEAVKVCYIDPLFGMNMNNCAYKSYISHGFDLFRKAESEAIEMCSFWVAMKQIRTTNMH